jgi:peptide deformylase
MLASVLRSDIAVQMSIKIVDAFVAMRHTLLNNDQLFNRIESIEHHQLIMLERQDKTESQIETIFQALSKYELPKENVFYNNQLFDAHILMSQLVESAQKRIVVIDTTGEDPILMINPRIIETSGEQTGYEGCLSVPGKSGMVTRPNYVKAVAYDENMEEFIIEGTELMARAICHELDHLEGILYKDVAEGPLHEVQMDDDEWEDE